MNLLVDTVSRVLTHDPAPLIRGCTETVTLQFRKGTAPFRLADGCAVQVGLKDWDNPADDILCYAVATRPAADNAPYTAELSLNTVELLAKFTAGVKYLNCSLEVKWETVAGSDKFTKTRRTKCRVDADTIRDTDAAPATVGSRADFVVDSGTGLTVTARRGILPSGAVVAAQGPLTLTDDATNYVQLNSSGVLTANTSGFTHGYYPLAVVITASGAITSNSDCRPWIDQRLTFGTGVLAALGEAVNGANGLVKFNGNVGAASATSINGLLLSLGLNSPLDSISIGANALTAQTSGTSNVAIGYYAYNLLTTGSANTATGAQSAQATNGDYNTAFGFCAMYRTTGAGSNNTVVGANALSQTTATVSRNTAIGDSALLNCAGSGNVAIGFLAGAFETGSDTFYIDNRNRTNLAGGRANALAYGTFAASAALQTIRWNVGTFTISGSIILETSSTPSGPSAAGVAGAIAWDSNYIYVCTATNTWKRTAISSAGW